MSGRKKREHGFSSPAGPIKRWLNGSEQNVGEKSSTLSSTEHSFILWYYIKNILITE